MNDCDSLVWVAKQLQRGTGIEKDLQGAWITTKSEWDDLSINLSIQTDFGFATYLFEKQLY